VALSEPGRLTQNISRRQSCRVRQESRVLIKLRITLTQSLDRLRSADAWKLIGPT
jgi:hypothetical protein